MTVIYRDWLTRVPLWRDPVGQVPQIGARLRVGEKLYVVETIIGHVTRAPKKHDLFPCVTGHATEWLVDIKDTGISPASVKEWYSWPSSS